MKPMAHSSKQHAQKFLRITEEPTDTTDEQGGFQKNTHCHPRHRNNKNYTNADKQEQPTDKKVSHFPTKFNMDSFGACKK